MKPDQQRTDRSILVNIVKARFLSIVVVLVLLVAAVAHIGIGWSPDRWMLIALVALLASIPFGVLTGMVAKSWFASTDWTYLIDLDARVLDGAVFRMPPTDLADFDVLDGELTELSPTLYAGKQVDLEERTVKGTWRGTLDDRELCRALQAVRECRASLEDDAKVGFALETQLHAVVRKAVRENTRTIVDTFESGTLPDDGAALDAAVSEALENFDVRESLEIEDNFDDLVEDVADDVALEDLSDHDVSAEDTDDLQEAPAND